VLFFTLTQLQARARDEWESALLQNANTRCNGLLPLWGPGVPESVYAACLARHNTYLVEVTGQRDIGFQVSRILEREVA
jgi:E3 ubiquitin-protein ligase UBR4